MNFFIFKTDAKNKAIIHYRATVTLWLSITGLIVLTPFAINNFIQSRYFLGVAAFFVASFLAMNAWKTHRDRTISEFTTMMSIIAIIVFLGFAFKQQGIIGALWSYPAILIIYFLLPLNKAIIFNAILLCMAVPSAVYYLEFNVAIRVIVTLMVVGFLTSIFVFIIQRQQKEVEEKELQLRQTIASASHELRTPLAIIVAQIEAMVDGIRPLDQQQLNLVSQSASHLTDLVSDINLLSLSDVNSFSYHKDTIRIDKILKDSLEAFDEQFKQREFVVSQSIESHLKVHADAKRLRQVIVNILGNCFRYSDQGAKISIRLKSQEHTVLLTVEDNGPGVSDKDLTLIFDRFYRVDKSRSRESGGSGLGLSLVKALIEDHQGEVTAEHAKSGGLKIAVTLPLVTHT